MEMRGGSRVTGFPVDHQQDGQQHDDRRDLDVDLVFLAHIHHVDEGGGRPGQIRGEIRPGDRRGDPLRYFGGRVYWASGDPSSPKTPTGSIHALLSLLVIISLLATGR